MYSYRIQSQRSLSPFGVFAEYCTHCNNRIDWNHPFGKFNVLSTSTQNVTPFFSVYFQPDNGIIVNRFQSCMNYLNFRRKLNRRRWDFIASNFSAQTKVTDKIFQSRLRRVISSTFFHVAISEEALDWFTGLKNRFSWLNICVIFVDG